MNTETELWLLFVTVATAVVPWAFSIHAKVAIIASSVAMIPEVLEQLKAKLSEHERRLDRHDQEIQTIKTAAVARN
jgi:hypothetical protein